jgi:hypothetical protein
MREFLTSGVVGNIEYDYNKKINEEVMRRWDGIHFLDGVPEGVLKENIARLYENEAKHLLYEATDSSNSGSFETVVFPIIRRVFSKLLANDIVSVQAMNLPVGKLFFILPITSQREWEAPSDEAAATMAAGGVADGVVGRHKGLMGYDRTNKNKDGRQEPRYYLPDEVINGLESKWYVPQLGETIADAKDYAEALAAAKAEGLTAAALRQAGPEVTQYFEKSLYDLFYDDFLYDNSKGKVTIRVGEAKAAKLTGAGFVELKDGETPAVHGYDGTIRNVVLKVSGFNAFNSGKLTGPDGNEMDTEEFLASLKVITKDAIAAKDGDIITSAFAKYESIPFRVVTQKYGKGIVEYNSKAVDAQGNIYIELDLTKPAAKGTTDGYVGIDPDAFKADGFDVAWAQYDSLELETEIGEVSFKLDSVTVSVTERKLRATWSPEVSQDVSAFHSIDAEAELTSILSEQIAAEVDREILRDLRKDAPFSRRFDVDGWKRQAVTSTNYTEKDWLQQLFREINIISASINKATLRGGANWVVVSAEVSALLDSLEYFHVTDASSEQNTYNMGIEKIGSLSGRYQVYVDPYSPYWSVIIGHKGKSLLDTGYVYAPYVPMQLTPTMYNPFNAAPIKYIMTRYAKKTVCNRYFGHLRVDGVPHFDINELR